MDWQQFRSTAHALLDDMISHVETVRSRSVWQPPPDDSRVRVFARPLPRNARSLDDVLGEVAEHVVPYGSGNMHPRFMGWAQGAGTPVGILAELIAATLNLNCGGRNHIGLVVERQISGWMSEAVGFPASASGLFLTGSSMANFLAVIVAKIQALGVGTRRSGIQDGRRQLVGYCSAEVHGCLPQAFELAGIGSENLRRVTVDAAGRMDAARLEEMIARDKAAGMTPFIVVATAGTVNTGAIDPLDAVADVAKQHQIWLHVDGAIGALAIFSPVLKPLLDGLGKADSIALDFHKWGHVPYDAGFLLVRDGEAHARAFASSTAYLQRAERGLGAGQLWPCDLGPDLSRSFRALKTWMTIATYGVDKIGNAISSNCDLARYFSDRICTSSLFELKAPVALNIVCFGLKGRTDGRINREIVMDVQEDGIAAPSWTTIAGEDVIRCAIFNHRTTQADVDAVLSALTERADAYLRPGFVA